MAIEAVADVKYNLTGDASDLNRALQGVQGSLDSVADATQATATASAKEIDKAVRRLETMAAGPVQKLAIQLKRTKEEIAALSAVTGDHAMAAKATTAAEKQFTDQIERMNAAAAAGRTQIQGATAGAQSMGQSFAKSNVNIGQTKEAIANLGAAISVFSPEVGTMITQVGAASGALKAVATVGPIVGVALAAVATVGVVVANAYMDATQGSRDFEAGMKAANAVLTPELYREAASAIKTMADSQEDLAYQLAVTTGALDDQEVAGAKAIERIREESRATLKLAAAKWAVLEFQRQELEARAFGQGISASERADAAKRLAQINESLPIVKAQLDAERSRVETLVETTNATNNIIRTEEKRKEAQKKGNDAFDYQAASAKELAARAQQLQEDWTEALKLIVDGMNEWGAAEIGLYKIRDEANADLLTDEEKILAIRDAQIAQIEELVGASGDRALADEAAAAVSAQAERDLAAIRREENAKTMEAYLDSADQLLSGMADLGAWMAEKTGKDAGKAAARWLAFSKAAGITEAIINGVVGAQAAFKSMAGIPYVGPILGAVAAAGVVATTAVAVGKITATEVPSYAFGGADYGTTGHPAVLDGTPFRPEYVATAEQVARNGGPQGVEKKLAEGGGMVAILKLDGRPAGKAIAKDTRRGGAMYRETAGKTREVGRR